MLRVAIVLLFAAGLGAGQVFTRLSDRPEIWDRVRGGLWNGHLLIGIEKNASSTPIVWTHDGSSRKEEIYFPILDAALVHISSFAGAEDGTIAVAGSTNDGKGFIGIIPAGRGENMILRPEGYRPTVITIAPDGVIWTIGMQKDLEDPKKTWFNVLKRYSPASGKLLTSEALNVFGKPNDPIDAATGSFLRSARDRVGWLTAQSTYLEYSLTGSEMSRFAGPLLDTKRYERVGNLALGDDLSVVASVGGKIWALDRMIKKWTWAKFEGEPVNLVFGFEGDQLVMGGNGKNRGFLLVRFRAALE